MSYQRMDGDNIPHTTIIQANGNTSRSGESSYEEFHGGSVPCPSCSGTGKIPREREHQLVALIPFSDHRLKPRRTCLYVSIAVGLCVAIGGLCLFFLLPRTIVVENLLKNLTPLNVTIDKNQTSVFMTIQNQYNITNNNFFPVSVDKLDVTVLFDEKIITMSTNKTSLNVPIRSTQTYYITLNVTFVGDEGYIAADICEHTGFGLFPIFEATVYTSYMGHTEQSTLTTYQHVKCSATNNSTKHSLATAPATKKVVAGLPPQKDAYRVTDLATSLSTRE